MFHFHCEQQRMSKLMQYKNGLRQVSSPYSINVELNNGKNSAITHHAHVLKMESICTLFISNVCQTLQTHYAGVKISICHGWLTLMSGEPPIPSSSSEWTN